MGSVRNEHTDMIDDSDNLKSPGEIQNLKRDVRASRAIAADTYVVKKSQFQKLVRKKLVLELLLDYLDGTFNV